MLLRQLMFIALMFAGLGLSTGCKPLDVDGDIPSCLRSDLRANDGPQELWEWQVDGETYYYLASQCCDQFNLLLDTDCNKICAPDGGFIGGGDGLCPTFTGEITKKKIWSRAE